jgi:hypothetical protein
VAIHRADWVDIPPPDDYAFAISASNVRNIEDNPNTYEYALHCQLSREATSVDKVNRGW